MTTIQQLLPPSLLLGPHLSAYRYFFVCTLTVASWDTLVLTTRWWRMMKTKEWPLLKIIMLLLRHLMPVEFIILAVSCFNPAFDADVCKKYYLFEPIMTSILMSLSSLALLIRVRAIHTSPTSPPSSSRNITLGLGALLAAQVAVHFACCFFYHPLNLPNQQGCISAPKHAWVGVFWVVPTVLYAATLALAVSRSLASLHEKPLGWWKLLNRDGLNLYATIFGINLINTIYFFSTSPTNDADPIRIIVSSLATVLTCTMTMRVILLVRGSLAHGGSFAGSSGPSNTTANGTITGAGRDGPYRVTAGSAAVGSGHGGPASRKAPGGAASRGVVNSTTASGAQASLAGTNASSRPAPGTNVIPGTGGQVKLSQPTFAVPQGEHGYDDEGDVIDVDVKKAHSIDEDGAVFEGEGKRREAWD